MRSESERVHKDENENGQNKKLNLVVMLQTHQEFLTRRTSTQMTILVICSPDEELLVSQFSFILFVFNFICDELSLRVVFPPWIQ